MKKLPGIVFAAVLFAPMVAFAQVESTAGSMKIGAHLDVSYRLSNESNKNPEADELAWAGYDSVTMQDVFLELSGAIGDRVSYKVLQGLIREQWSPPQALLTGAGTTINFFIQPQAQSLPLEAYVDLRILDQIKLRFGKQIVPTIIANTGVHQMKIIHTVNPPLIAQTSTSVGPLGINELLSVSATRGQFPKVPLPLSVTGAAVIVAISGMELSYTLYDQWLQPENAVIGVSWGDSLFDFNKTRGGNAALSYNGPAGSGKLNARIFYTDEDSEVDPAAVPAADHVKSTAWGAGMFYNADKFFLGGEYANSTLKYNNDTTPNTNTWSGYYLAAGAEFSSLEIVYRFDSIDYNNLKNSDFATTPAPFKPSSVDTETWHTIAVNYLVNDQTTVGLNYVIKTPEKGMYYDTAAGDYDELKYPNSDELSLLVEVDLL